MADTTKRHALAELLEADAPPHIQGIYAEIRQLGGVPMVALIYRHLATIPGVIEQTWAELGPLFRSGLPQTEAWGIADGIVLQPERRITANELRSTGIGRAEHAAVINVLDAYNRANPLNMMGVACLLARLGAQAAPREPLLAQPWAPPEPIGPLPPMTPPTDIPADVAELISGISPRAASGELQAVPSLYRHFCLWPAFLRLCRDRLEPQLTQGAIDIEAARIKADLQIAAGRLARHMSPLPRTLEWERAATALQRFTGMIPEMTVIGTVLRRALPDP